MARAVRRFRPGRRILIIDGEKNGSLPVEELNQTSLAGESIGFGSGPWPKDIGDAVLQLDQVGNARDYEVRLRSQNRVRWEGVGHDAIGGGVGRASDSEAADVFAPGLGI